MVLTNRSVLIQEDRGNPGGPVNIQTSRERKLVLDPALGPRIAWISLSSAPQRIITREGVNVKRREMQSCEVGERSVRRGKSRDTV